MKLAIMEDDGTWHEVVDAIEEKHLHDREIAQEIIWDIKALIRHIKDLETQGDLNG